MWKQYWRWMVGVAGALSAASLAPAQSVEYTRDIKPILQARCYACHGTLKPQAALRLDAGRLIQQGSENGAILQHDRPDESLLLRRISASDVAERMPPEGEPLSAGQIASIRQWILQGAQFPADEQPEADPRQHWAFQSPVRAPLPPARGPEQVRNPIDSFVAQALAEQGLPPQPPAPKPLWLRRVYLDLIGLPPTRDELQAFLADESPRAYERVVDHLLASPQYGERWARHWMDVWRYSDWFGRRHVPDVWNSAPQIWRWRDWIVRSLNDDQGYDRMIVEMLAADEAEPENDEAGYATGYLIRNWYALNPNDWMRSNVEHTGKAFLGLTLNCAHCHDHKYDPITQDDYFRFRAFFEPIGIRQDRVPGEADPGPFQEYSYSVLRKIIRLGAVRIYDKNPDAPTWFYTGGDERNRVTERGSLPPGTPAFLTPSALQIQPIDLPRHAWNPGLRPAIHETERNACRAAIALAMNGLSVVEAEAPSELPGDKTRELKRKVAAANLAAAQAALASVEGRIAAERAKYGETPGGDAEALARTASQLERTAAVRQAEANVLVQEELLAAAEAKPAEDANRAKDIEAANKQLADARTALDKANTALGDQSLEATYTPFGPTFPQTSTGRRLALAHWLTQRDNPLTARVAVNHIWLRHFHSPLVASVYDFGRNGQAPTHPELLDWLAVEFMESGWSMKHLHRLIVTSETYRRKAGAGAGEPDPENKYLSRMNVGRMEAEVVRDSLLACAGRLDLRIGGQELENSEALTTRRRSLYYSCHPEVDGKSELGALFDAAEANECYRRTRSVVPQQALALTNSDLVQAASVDIARQLWQSMSPDEQSRPSAFIAAAYEQILSRPPAEAELQVCAEYLSAAGEASASDRLRASLVRALLNHNDFVSIR